MQKVFAVAAALWACTAVGAEAAPDKVAEYQALTSHYQFLCWATMRVEQTPSAAPDASASAPMKTHRECVDDAKTKTLAAIKVALKAVKKPAAATALKNYHAMFMSALEGQVPSYDERRITYEARQQQLKDRVNEAWARFEVER